MCFISISDRPYISSRTPASKEFNAIAGVSVSLTFYFSADPALTSVTNWSFINTAAQPQDLPEHSVFSNTNSQFSAQFTLTSEVYYGNYSITLNNAIGSTTETFQVIRPGKYITYTSYKLSHAIYIYVHIYPIGPSSPF